MTRILIVDSNGPGLPALGPGFAAVLQKLSGSITCSLCAPYLGQALRDIWRQVTRWQVPIWGSCNGMQLAAFMLGGICAASPRGDEEGLAEAITLTDIGREHPMIQGRASQFRVPCVHRDEVQRLPNGAVLLAGNAHSPVQAFAYETADISFWGTQYHPEFSRADVATWLADRGKSLPDSEEQDGQGDLALATRTLELQNWLAHVTSRQRTTGAK